MRFTNLGGLMAALSLLACANVYAGLSSGEPIYFYDINGNKVGQGSAKSTVDDITVESGSTASLKSFDGGGAQQMMLLPGDVEIAESLKGESSVSPTGVAGYSIPIQLPRSLAGFGPSLSIEYSSQSQSGLLGAGWSISGLQQISRCPQTIAQDGVRRSVRFDANDRFCLNGQRLVLISGTYGGAGAEYRTEIESFAKIVSYGTAGAGPEHFKVWTKGGQIMEFGVTSDSRLYTNSTDSAGVISQQATVQAWSLNRVEDRKSNYWTISYESNLGDGLLYPSYIQYAGNVNENILPLNRVYFLYEDALPGEVSLQYQAGSRLSLGKRMDMVKSSVNGESATEYRFEYDDLDDGGNDFVRSRLGSVTECRYQQGVAHCLLPAEFEWSSDASFDVSNVTKTRHSVSLDYNPSSYQQMVGDISGDGRADVTIAHWDGFTLRVRSMLGMHGDNSVTFGSPIQRNSSGVTNSGINSDFGNITSFAMADVDLDGKADLLLSSIGPAGFKVYEMLSSGDGTFLKATERVLDSASYSTSYKFYVADLNADSIPDYVAYLEEEDQRKSTVVAAVRNITGAVEPAVATVVNHPSGDLGVLLNRSFADIDGDGKPDLIIGVRRNAADYAAYISLGDGLGGFAANVVEVMAATAADISSATHDNVEANEGYSPDAYNLAIVDVNRDGLADIVLDMVLSQDHCDTSACPTNPVYSLCSYQSGGCDLFHQGVHVALSRGDLSFQNAGYFGDVSYAPAAGNIDSWLPVYGDVDGDGALDVVRISLDEANRLWILLSLGMGNGEFYVSLGGNLSTGSVAFKYGLTGVGTAAVQNDLNADGIPDIIIPMVYHNSADGPSMSAMVSRFVRYGTSTPQQQNLLTKVVLGNGVSTEFSYRTLASRPSFHQKDTDAIYPILDLNMPMLAVEAHKSYLAGLQQWEERYSYQGAKADLNGRGFLGFRSQKVLSYLGATLPGGGIQRISEEVVYERRQDFPYTGMIVAATQKVDNVLVGESSSDPQQDFSFVNTHTGVYFPRVDKISSSKYDPVSGVLISTSERTSSYDNYGNETLTSTVSQNADATEVYTQSVAKIYHPANITDWIINLVSRQTTTYQRSGLPSIAQITDYDYFADGYLKTEEIEPNDAALNLVAEYLYDPYGNQVAKTVSGSGDPAYPDTAIQTRTSQSLYEAGTGYPAGVFLTSEINPLGHTVEYQYDPITGVATQLTDANGLVTTIDLDALGREVLRQTPDGVQKSTDYELCVGGAPVGSGTTGCEVGEYLKITSGKVGVAPRYMFLDGLEREIRSVELAYDGVNYIIARQEYDKLIGRLMRTSNPAFSSVPYGNLHWTVYTYDNVGRKKSETLPGRGTTYFSYDGLERVATNAKSQVRKERMNILGEKVEIEDALGGIMTYSIDAAGRLIGTEDAKQNVITHILDTYGRKLQQQDPDLGVWNYRYNVLGEVVWQQDAKGQVTTLAYDKLGRVTDRIEADLVSAWVWDSAANGIGKLAQSTGDNGFERHYQYDAFGRQHRVVTKNSIDPFSQISDPDYVHRTEYDALGRVYVEVYPTGLGYQNVYDGNGYLSEVRNHLTGQLYWRAESRDANGRVVRQTLGNGLVTDRTYKEDSGYIEAVETGALSNGQVLADIQNDVYGFDSLGNLTFRTIGSSQGGFAETYGYDDLNRLELVSPIGGRQQTTVYDEIGNIRIRTGQGFYSYSGCGGAHRVCSVSTQTGTYSYDANGNVLSSGTPMFGDGYTVSWTSANYPEQISSNSGVESFLYSPERDRVRRVSVVGGATTTVVYLNPRIDLGNTFEKVYKPDSSIEYVHYIYAGTELIGSVVTESASELWSTDLSSEPSTSNPNAVGLTMPSNDPAGSIYWEESNGGGHLAFAAKYAASTGAPSVAGQRLYVDESVVFRGEVTPTANTSETGPGYLLFRVVNNGDVSGDKTLRMHALYLNGGGVYASYIDGSDFQTNGDLDQASESLGYSVQADSVYVVEVETTPTTSTLYFYPKGEDRAAGVSHALSIDWRGPVGALSRGLQIHGRNAPDLVSNVTYVDNISERTLIVDPMRYYHFDHQQSVSVITDENGLLLERFRYDAWGKREDIAGSEQSSPVWATDFSVEATTQNPNPAGMTMPDSVEDPLGLLQWVSQQGGRVRVRSSSNALVTQPRLRSQNLFTRYDHIISKVEMNQNLYKTGRVLRVMVTNDGSDDAASKTLRYHDISIVDGKAYARVIDGSATDPVTGDLVPVVYDLNHTMPADGGGATYTFEIETTSYSSAVYLHSGDRSQGISHEIFLDWHGHDLQSTRHFAIATESGPGLSNEDSYLDNAGEISVQYIGDMTPEAQFSSRGYTAHEHLDSIGLIHMNGRVYDPAVGRFLSADPNVFYPENMQDFNRYSYVQNNPLSFTDPSGFQMLMMDYDQMVNANISDALTADMLRTMNSLMNFSINSVSSSQINLTGGFQLYGSNSDAKGGQEAIFLRSSSALSAESGYFDMVFGSLFSGQNLEKNGPSVHDGMAISKNIGSGMLSPYMSIYPNSHNNYHSYDVGPTRLCYAVEAGCGYDFLSGVVSSRSVPLNLAYSGPGVYQLPYGIGLDPIVNFNPEAGIWINQTLDGHRYHPGRVGHALYQSSGSYWLYSQGVGIGDDPGENVFMGNILFQSMHQSVREDVFDNLTLPYLYFK